MCDFMIDVVVKNRKLNSSCNMFVIYVGKIDMILFVCWIGNLGSWFVWVRVYWYLVIFYVINMLNYKVFNFNVMYYFKLKFNCNWVFF